MANGVVFKVVKNNNYTCINNSVFKEKKLSWAAKGLLCCMLSLPPEWDYSVRGLCALGKASESTIYRLLKELQKFGYVEIKKIYPDKSGTGLIRYEYYIYEIPHNKHIDV